MSTKCKIVLLFQRLSVLVQRFNAVAFRSTFADDSELRSGHFGVNV